jgi:hypothetical protein
MVKIATFAKPKNVPATLKDDRATLTQTINIQADSVTTSFGWTLKRHARTNASCLFFPNRTKILKFNGNRTLHTFGSHPNPQANQSGSQKSAILPTHFKSYRENKSIFGNHKTSNYMT